VREPEFHFSVFRESHDLGEMGTFDVADFDRIGRFFAQIGDGKPAVFVSYSAFLEFSDKNGSISQGFFRFALDDVAAQSEVAILSVQPDCAQQAKARDAGFAVQHFSKKLVKRFENQRIETQITGGPRRSVESQAVFDWTGEW